MWHSSDVPSIRQLAAAPRRLTPRSDAVRALSAPRARWVALLTTVVVAVVIGVPTVLIPNPWFVRDVPVQAWSYPVWAATAVLSGVLAATYVRSQPAPAAPRRLGVAGALLCWFAVGCPVCNKLVLLALGYSGAISWFMPLQPWLAGIALLATALALALRLGGRVSCPLPRRAVP